MEEQKKESIHFEDYVENYQQKIQESINFAGQDAEFFIKVKAEMVLRLIEKYGLNFESSKILDVGCGVGLVDKHLTGKIKNLYGVDIEQKVVDKAALNNPEVKYSLFSGEDLPFNNGSMDMVFAINVMHHVPPAQWDLFASEMYRVLKPGGVAAVFEHNPANPLTRRVVNKCEFDRDAVLLSHNRLSNIFINARFALTEDPYILFFPFKANVFRTLEKFLKWVPLGAQHVVVGKKLK